MHSDPNLTSTLIAMSAGLLMLRAGIAKRKLGWRKVERRQRRRRR
jgi:hypothetical protein